MKKIGNKIISAILAGMMLFGSVPLAGAAYEEYLPTITRLENENGVAMFYYTVPFEGDAFQYGFLTSSENMGTGSWWTQNWNGAGVEQSMNVHLSGTIEEGVFPIVIELFEQSEKENEYNFSSMLARQESGYYVDITALPPMETMDLNFIESQDSYMVELDDGTAVEQTNWEVNLGADYPKGMYVAYDITHSGIDYVTSVNYDGQELILNMWDATEARHAINKENLVLQRITCTGVSPDGKTIYVEATQAQHTDEWDEETANKPEIQPQPTIEYIYGENNPAENMDFVGTLDDVADETSAVDAVDNALTEVTDEQKQSVTGIDKLTLLAEEAAAKANTVSVDSGVINVTSADIPATADSALTATTGVLSDAGVNMQRNPRAIVNYDAGSSETVSVTTESLPETVDKVRVTTDYAMATVDAQQASSFTMSDRGNQTIEVNFDTDYETVVTVSFPGVSANDTYKAVVDAEGKPVGGKYNPATGTLEAKLTESGVYRVVNNEADFSDIKTKSQEMQDAIKELASKGIINGITETTYAPDDTISRAEVTALLMRTLSLLNPNANGGFADVTSANWYCGAAGSAKEHNIINGFEDNTFRGDAVIAKDQIVAVSSRTLREQMDYKTPSDVNGELSVYSDAGSIENWAREDVALATMTNLVLKRTDGKFGGSAGMTRGDAAIIIKRLFDKMW